ncbi:MAG: hypothetical protein ACM32I_03360 [Nitrospirota bacterium]|jgi:hypothetical protein
MFILSLKKKITFPAQPSHKFCDCEFGCYGEEYFQELLSFEKKRSGRSGRPFLMMTIDVTRIQRTQKRPQAIRNIVDVLTTLMRDTDIKGWYKNAAVLGVIFTEMNSLEPEKMRMKLVKNLWATLAEDHLYALKINFQMFFNGSKPGVITPTNQIPLYPYLTATDVQSNSGDKAQKAA